MRTWLEKQFYLIDFTVSSLRRRTVKNLALLAVYTVLVFVVASVMLFGHAIRHEAALVLKGAPEVTVQRMVAGRHDRIPAAYLGKLQGIRGVGQVRGRLWGYHFDPANGANYTVVVPPGDSVERGTVAIGRGVARVRGQGVGGHLFFVTYRGKLFKLRIVRLLDAESEIVSSDLILMSGPDFRDFFEFPEDRFTDIVLTVRNPREIATVSAKIAKALPDTRIITRDDVLRTYRSILDWREGMILVLITGAVLAFVIFAWEKASGLGADERREIGVLKAIGWETGDIIRMKLAEGGLVSLTAFLFGYALAYCHVFYFSLGLFEPVLKGWSVLFPAYRLVPAVDAVQLATLFFFVVVPYTAATIVPVWRAATVDPDTVMR